MSRQTPAFALIGRSHTSDAFELLYQASLAARAERRALQRARGCGPPRRRDAGEPLALSLRLPG